ncbi:MAG TPA: hypothetical protein VEI97_11465, partial [bacterium]|nr:hypothetical protein [bacterium]
MLADRPHDHETYEDRAHRDLPLVWWVLDYTLAAIFIVVGPLYYITEAQAHPFLAQAGRTLIQVIQLGIH